jgi:D-amino-acid dehydrogenase
VAKYGVPFEAWTAAEVREREPALIGPVSGAFFHPQDAHCEPYLAVSALAAEARRAGVTLVEDADVYGAEHSGGSVTRLQTSRGPVEATNVVLATGAWSRRVAATFGLNIPMLGAKGYSIIIPRLAVHPTRSIMLAERKVAINPHADALRISGTLELVDEDLSVTQRRVQAILRAARGMLPLPEPLDVREVWRGLRPTSSDGMPIIGRARGMKNLWLATGHQMTGLKTAPGTGRLLADLMTGATPMFDPAPFRADRFG